MSTVQVSQTLRNLLKEYAEAMKKPRELLQKVVEQARKEGITDADLKILIKQALEKRGLSERSVRRHMPDELKDKEKQEAAYKGNEARRQEQAETEVEMPSASEEQDLVSIDVPKFFMTLFAANRNNCRAFLKVNARNEVVEVVLETGQ